MLSAQVTTGIIAPIAAAAALAGASAAPLSFVRVGLVDNVSAVVFGVATPSALVSAAGATISIAPDGAWQALPGTGSVFLVPPAGATLSVVPPLTLVPPSGEAVFVGKRWYRGSLEILPAPEGGLVAVNQLPLEEYLYGVVPGEMPPTWHLEALKAQAIAARTYTVSRLGARKARGYDVKPTVDDQVYGGLGVEATASSAAVAATTGQIMTYAGEPIQAYYCAGAGGFTEGAESVQGFERKVPGRRPGGYPYLQPVPDFDWDSPRWLWQIAISAEELRKKLETRNIHVGAVKRLEIVERSFSGRVRWVRIRGDLGRHELTGPQLRFALGLNSALFSVSAAPDGTFYFVGRGWGHGVGMSQWGARKMAEWGYDYEDILGHYYPGAELEVFGGRRNLASRP